METSCTSPVVLVIEGGIGAGKSTLLDKLLIRFQREGYIAVGIPEPVDEWISSGALADFYKDPKAKAYDFHKYTLYTRIIRMRDVQEAFPEADIYICERHVCGARHTFVELMYQNKYMDESQLKAYENYSDILKPMIVMEPTHMIYLKATPELCTQRAKLRNRDSEQQIPLSYHTQLCNLHDAYITTKCTLPRLTLPADYNQDSEHVMSAIYSQVKALLNINKPPLP